MPRNATVVAEAPTSCLALASWDFEKVLLEQPALALAILRGVAARLREVDRLTATEATDGHARPCGATGDR